MVLTFAIIGAIIWFVFIFLVLRSKQTPEAQLRKRLNEMIDQAEETRRKHPKLKKNATPTQVEISENLPKIKPRIKPFFDRVIRPILNAFEERAQKLAPREIKLQLEDKIFRAGKTSIWSVQRLISFWCLSIAICTLIALLAVQGSNLHPLQQVMVIALGSFFGAAIPFAAINMQIRKRQISMRKQLPEFLDLLCVSVQAGLSFDGAVGKMIKRMQGPLIDEFSRMLNDVALGMTHQYAMTAMAKRCDLEEIYLFTTSVIQAEKLGTSMTRTLKVQADNMRDRHRQWVKSEALKAPIKMLFPMILFIFPAMFVVLLFPAIFTLLQNLGNK